MPVAQPEARHLPTLVSGDLSSIPFGSSLSTTNDSLRIDQSAQSALDKNGGGNIVTCRSTVFKRKRNGIGKKLLFHPYASNYWAQAAAAASSYVYIICGGWLVREGEPENTEFWRAAAAAHIHDSLRSETLGDFQQLLFWSTSFPPDTRI